MRDGERLFPFGMQWVIVMLLLVAAFRVLYSNDEKKLNAQNAQIVVLEQDIANASVKLAALMRPEVLRPIVMQIYPGYRPVGTGRTISAAVME